MKKVKSPAKSKGKKDVLGQLRCRWSRDREPGSQLKFGGDAVEKAPVTHR